MDLKEEGGSPYSPDRGDEDVEKREQDIKREVKEERRSESPQRRIKRESTSPQRKEEREEQRDNRRNERREDSRFEEDEPRRRESNRGDNRRDDRRDDRNYGRRDDRDERRDERDYRRDDRRDRRDDYRRGEDRRSRREDRRSRSPERREYNSNRRDESRNREDRTLRKPETAEKTESIVRKVQGDGVYIPPFRLAQMKKQIEDKTSIEYQKLSWEALKKSINGLINKVSVNNISVLISEIFYENLVRGRGLFARSMMKAQASSTTFTNVYAALLAIINTKMPEIGELVVKRLILAFRKAYSRNDKAGCYSSLQFIAHLLNQQVIGILAGLQIAALLLGKPTDDSVEMAVSFITECGALLYDLHPKGFNQIFDRFRAILHEGEIDKRVQYTIESLFELRKKNFASHPPIRPELDLVELEDQITHDINLDSKLDPEDSLNYFHADENFEENEKKYQFIREEILGEETVQELEGRKNKGSGEMESDEEEEEEKEGAGVDQMAVTDNQNENKILDNTETDLINLRRTIYLTIMSSMDFEECAHKLLKIKFQPGQEKELCNMLIECCCQEKTYLKFYGLLGQRFCDLDRVYREGFEECFAGQYATIHRLDTNKLRNVAKFFAHLLHSDGLPWTIMEYIRLNEEETTSSGRIFIKIIFQELAEFLGLPKLNERLQDPIMQPYYSNLLPRDSPQNTRFAINFFTYIGLGGLTEGLREHLKNAPQRMLEQQQRQLADDSSSSDSDSDSSSSSSSDSSSSDSSSSDSDSDSEEDRKRKRTRR